MRKILFSALALSTFVQVNAQKVPDKFAKTIQAEDLKKHLTFIASDSLKGRDTGSPEQKVAAQYIADHFKKCGLKPIGKDNSYFQPVDLVKRTWTDVYLKNGGKKYEYLKDFMANSLAPIQNEKNVDLVFAGYGIETDKWNDYVNLNVKDKYVIIFEGEPKGQDGNFPVSGTAEASKFGKADSWREKLKIAQAKGAKGMLMVTKNTDEEFLKMVKQRQVMMQRFGSARMIFRDQAEPSAADFPVLTISSAMAAEIYDATTNDVQETKDAFLSGKKAADFGLPNPSIALKIERTEVPVETSNVLGYLEGTDKKDEVIVVTAHYDHIGISADGKINNGANDDGSGTVTVMEIAEAFGLAAKAGKLPRRSILFMTVTGEEKGLLGSEYYVNHPILPLDKTVCDLNIDMVGRVDKDHEGKPDYIYVIGSDKLSSELHAIQEEQNKKTVNLELDYRFNDPNDPNRFYYRSDHYNFAKNKIPVAFFFNGVHDDYHAPTDDVEKIQFDKAEKVGRLVFYMAWDIANRDKRLVVDSNKP